MSCLAQKIESFDHSEFWTGHDLDVMPGHDLKVVVYREHSQSRENITNNRACCAIASLPKKRRQTEGA